MLTALVLICCNTISGDAPRTAVTPSAVETKAATISERASEVDASKPDVPTPKTGISSSSNSSKADLDLDAGGEPSSLAIQPPLNSPVKPATTESYETSRQRTIWYGLMALDHGTAAFDAWTTRRAVGGGWGIEGDPLQRPFANSGAIYATTQVAPVIMDYLGHRMMRSSHPFIRKAWWVPQAASASVSLGAGLHNYSLVP
jgi:hypothetical protein